MFDVWCYERQRSSLCQRFDEHWFATTTNKFFELIKWKRRRCWLFGLLPRSKQQNAIGSIDTKTFIRRPIDQWLNDADMQLLPDVVEPANLVWRNLLRILQHRDNVLISLHHFFLFSFFCFLTGIGRNGARFRNAFANSFTLNSFDFYCTSQIKSNWSSNNSSSYMKCLQCS